IFACASACRAFLRGGAIPVLLNEELRRVHNDALRLGPWTQSEWTLHQGDGFSISISAFERERRDLHALPFQGLFGAIGPVGFSCEIYRLPDAYRNEIFDRSIRLSRSDTPVFTGPGEVLELDTGRSVYDIRKGGAPFAVLKVLTGPVRPFEWLFGRTG